MGKMEAAGEIIKQKQLGKPPSTNVGNKTLQRYDRSSPTSTWVPILIMMAQDKRHDLAPGILAYWKAKLSRFADGEIVEALMECHAEFFPSVDEVVTVIEAKQRLSAAEAAMGDWERWKSKQHQAEAEGLLATEEEYEQTRRQLREVFAKAERLTAERRNELMKRCAEFESKRLPSQTTSNGTNSSAQAGSGETRSEESGK